MAEIEIDDRDVEQVWSALVDQKQLARWLGSDSELAPTPGGAVYTSDIVTGEPKRGTVTDVERERRLVFDWWPVSDPQQVSQVTIELAPTRRGTLVTVTESAPGGGGGRAGSARACARSGRASACASRWGVSGGVAPFGSGAGLWSTDWIGRLVRLDGQVRCGGRVAGALGPAVATA